MKSRFSPVLIPVKITLTLLHPVLMHYKHSELVGLERFHRHQLRLVLGIRHPRRIANAALYQRCYA